MMDEKSLQMLEFPKIRRIIAGFTTFPISHELAESLVPSSDPRVVSLLLKQSTEARQLLELNPGFSIGEATDIHEPVALAAREKTLDPQTLIEIQATLAAGNHLKATLSKSDIEFPSLWDIAEQITMLPHIEQEISRCIDAAGDIMESASPTLVALRQQLKETRQLLLIRLENIVKSLSSQNLLQDSIITERSGRYVVPVKVEHQSEVKGMIHDISNTGATVFIEPWAIVKDGNNLKQLALEEQREVNRILAHLSAEVGSHASEIYRNLELLAEIDLVLAKARYARSAHAAEPSIPISNGNDIPRSGSLRLVNARHPLLSKDTVVPLSIELGNDFSTLVITGPNTGGKTVAIKTIGLLVLMTQSGIPIPASEESVVPVFDAVFADIGDEQSIEQTLSTFSWHMGNIVRIIDASSENSLVLLDELGGSTDPTEGAALARAIMLHFLSQGNLVIATTHYSELKIFAHSTPNMQNASLEFDPVTLTPTYHLTLGIPGGSNALAIASHLGLPPHIIDSAKEGLSKGTEEIEQLLADLTIEKQSSRHVRHDLEREKSEVKDIRAQLENELQSFREKERSAFLETRERISAEIAGLHRQIQQATSELKNTRSKESIERAKKQLSSVREQLSSHVWHIEGVTTEEAAEFESIAVGDTVRITDTNLRGTVLAISPKNNQAEIQVGRTKFKVGIEDTEKTEPFKEKATTKSFEMKRDPGQPRRSIELDIRGKRAEEVEPELDAYLNDVSIAGFHEVRIIHGYGTGTVRQIVRDMLASHPLVRSFRSGEQGEGGDGVTIAKL